MNHDETKEISEQLAYMVEVLHRLVNMTADTLTALQLLLEALGMTEEEDAQDGYGE